MFSKDSQSQGPSKAKRFARRAAIGAVVAGLLAGATVTGAGAASASTVSSYLCAKAEIAQTLPSCHQETLGVRWQ